MEEESGESQEGLNYDMYEDEDSSSLGTTHFYHSTRTTTFSSSSEEGSSNASSNATSSEDINPPSFLEMSEVSRNCVIIYCILFVISGTGNFSVLFSVLRQMRHCRNRISLLILHLCIADLLVTFTTMPLEIVWRITIWWYGGDLLCKVCQFFRAFGLYLSSMVVICISLDRYFAIIHPLKLANAARRVKLTLTIAWVVALVCASPQAVIFHVMQHPKYPEFHQCLTFTFLTSDQNQELFYNLFSVSALYFVPLLIILFTYCRIVWKIFYKSRKHEREVAERKKSIAVVYHHRQHNGHPPRRKVSTSVATSQVDSEDGESGGATNVNIFYRTNSCDRKKMNLGSTLSEKHSSSCEANAISNNPSLSPPPPRPTNSSSNGPVTRNPSTGASGGTTGCGEDIVPASGFSRKPTLRTSAGGSVLLARARVRALRLTCIIVLTFVFCWTPYVVMTLWYMLDRKGAQSVDNRVQELLFLMAVSNSVVNPLIYGTYGNSECSRGSTPCPRYGNYSVSVKKRARGKKGGGTQQLSPTTSQPQHGHGGGHQSHINSNGQRHTNNRHNNHSYRHQRSSLTTTIGGNGNTLTSVVITQHVDLT